MFSNVVKSRNTVQWVLYITPLHQEENALNGLYLLPETVAPDKVCITGREILFSMARLKRLKKCITSKLI